MDVDKDILTGIYERIRAQQFKPGTDHVSQVMKVESMVIGKKPLQVCHHMLHGSQLQQMKI